MGGEIFSRESTHFRFCTRTHSYTHTHDILIFYKEVELRIS